MFKGLWQLLKKKLDRKKKDDDAEKEEEIASFSMNEGKPDQVFGVRREIVNGIGIFFIVVFCLAFIFATGDDDEEKPVETQSTVSEADIASLKKPKDLPNDYETFVAESQTANAEAAKAKSPEPVPKTADPEPMVSQMPRNYSAMPVIPEPVRQSSDTTAEKPQNDRYKSAIAFSLGGSSLNTGSNSVSGQQGDSVRGNESGGTLAAPAYYAPNDLTINAGTTIPVRLLTGINTDVEGQVKAEVLSDVYDSATGTKLLIPQGTKIMGSYEQGKATGGRVSVSFRQMLLPSGGFWDIAGRMTAMDGAGYTGIKGKVHHHTGQKISGGAIGAGIAALGSLAAGNTSSRDTYTAGQIAAQGALANMINVSSQLFQQAANIKDTVTVEPGYEFSIYVTENITF